LPSTASLTQGRIDRISLHNTAFQGQSMNTILGIDTLGQM